jgi:hypothetical protein
MRSLPCDTPAVTFTVLIGCSPISFRGTRAAPAGPSDGIPRMGLLSSSLGKPLGPVDIFFADFFSPQKNPAVQRITSGVPKYTGRDAGKSLLKKAVCFNGSGLVQKPNGNNKYANQYPLRTCRTISK